MIGFCSILVLYVERTTKLVGVELSVVIISKSSRRATVVFTHFVLIYVSSFFLSSFPSLLLTFYIKY